MMTDGDFLSHGACKRTDAFFKSQTHSEMQSQVAKFRKVMHEQEVQQEQGLENMRTLEAQLRPQLHSEEQKVASTVDAGSLKETFESKRQAGKTRLRNPVTFQEGSIRSDISL